jgi:hypothetical protein
MIKNRIIHLPVSVLILLLLATACTGTVAPAQPSTITPAPADTATSIPATATLAATDTIQPSPTVIPPTETPANPQPTAGSQPAVISAANVANLTSTPLTLPGYAQRALWPASMPENYPKADLLVQVETTLQPVTVNPPALGQPIPLPLNGTTLMDITRDASLLAVKDPSQFGLYTLAGQKTVTIDEPNAYGASFSEDGKFIVVTTPDKWQADVYDTATGKEINILTGFETAAPVYGVGIAPGGKAIAWIARATLEFQDVATGQMGAKFGFEDFIGATAFSPDGQKLALSVAGRLEVVTVPDGQQLAKIELSQPLRSLAFSPDGSLLAGAYGSTVQVWDTATWTPVATLTGDATSTTYLSLVSFSPDGRYLVSSDENNQLRIWSVK